jgi:hypothetical protein
MLLLADAEHASSLPPNEVVSDLEFGALPHTAHQTPTVRNVLRDISNIVLKTIGTSWNG